MKKLLIALLLLCLAAAPFAGLSEAEQAVLEIKWEDVAEAVEQIPGGFISPEGLSIQFWLPDVFQPFELQLDNPFIQILHAYGTEDQAASIVVTFNEMPDGMNAYREMMSEHGGASEFEEGYINDLYFFSYDVKDNDATVVCFPTEEDTVVSFMMSPVSDQAIAGVFAIIAASFQPAD